jgi:UDP-N-acetylmuramate: L-alanyl-gamma-D-glutamyl-meso-diaminopimelate ligase
MKRIHFIAIGGAAMHNLAIAVSKKPDHVVTGSDDEIFEPSKSRLENFGLLPSVMGWFPDRITKELDAVILGMHARADNPELLRAKELGIDIYSFPEYLYHQTRKKVRVVVGGSHGKTTTTAIILHVLRKLNRNADYMVGAQIEGFDTMVKLSYDAQLAVFEGDEYLTSPIDPRPKFHLYHPHIALLTGIAWDHINVFPTFENYVEQFKIFTDQIERDGRLIYFEGDEQLRAIAKKVRPDIVTIPYTIPDYEIVNGITNILYKDKKYPLCVFGQHNLQNIQGARLVCKQLGIKESEFLEAIADFGGASNRLEKTVETTSSVAFKDFAHSPSKLKATVSAVKEQYPDKKLVACMELHTFSSLQENFLPQYKGCMDEADAAFVYFNPEVIAHKRLPPITTEQVKTAFGRKDLLVFTDARKLIQKLQSLRYEGTALLMMSSGNFSGLDIPAFEKELLTQPA